MNKWQLHLESPKLNKLTTLTRVEHSLLKVPLPSRSSPMPSKYIISMKRQVGLLYYLTIHRHNSFIQRSIMDNNRKNQYSILNNFLASRQISSE
jgi:hypothetical protein